VLNFKESASLLGRARGFDFEFSALEFSLQYLAFEGLPLFLGEDTGIAFLFYFRLCFWYLDYRALRGSAAWDYDFNVVVTPFVLKIQSPCRSHPQAPVFIIFNINLDNTRLLPLIILHFFVLIS